LKIPVYTLIKWGILICSFYLAGARAALAQVTKAEREIPTLRYFIKVDSTNLHGYGITISMTHAPLHFQLAMATHDEYDDRFWRFVRDFRVETVAGPAAWRKTDSAVWDINVRGEEVQVHYWIELPPITHYAHRPFLASYGGLIGGLHSFMYLVGHSADPVKISLDVPIGWRVATGLEKSVDGTSYEAKSARELLDCPILIGNLHQWTFWLRRVKHTVAYLSGAKPDFDTLKFVGDIQKIAKQCWGLFGEPPYKQYDFLILDSVFGALEHANSVTFGAPVVWLKEHMSEAEAGIAHEFFHTWNLVGISPAGWGRLHFGPQVNSDVLWFGEGLTMFYADLVLRRAGLPTEDSTRTEHLASLITQYYADTGNTLFSPAAVSLASNLPPGPLGDYSASTHLQGELLGSMLDLLIRYNSLGRHTLDDLMRGMWQEFAGGRGINARDIESAARRVCPGKAISLFFEKYVYLGKSLDFNEFLPHIALDCEVHFAPALLPNGQPKTDTRIYVWRPAGDSLFHIILNSTSSCWARAGLHAGDAILAFGGRNVKNSPDFYSRISQLKIGDSVTFRVLHNGGEEDKTVNVTGYTSPVVHIALQRNSASFNQGLYAAWVRSK
jgi:predicted metalloprotease with PDZ domain